MAMMTPDRITSLQQQQQQKQQRLLMLALCISSLYVFIVDSAATVKTVRRKAQKCDYTFVVQEFDPNLCPSVFGQFSKAGGGGGTAAQGLIEGSTGRPLQASTAAGHGTTGRPAGPEAIASYFNDGSAKQQLKRNAVTSIQDVPSSNTLNEMLQKIEEIEVKIQATTSINNQLKATRDLQSARIDQLESQLRNLESTSSQGLDRVDLALRNVEGNFTGIIEDMTELGQQKSYWKSVDVKLAGLMLDMTETNQAIARHDRQLEKLGVNEKVISVQTTSEVVGCSIAPDAPKYRDCEDIYANGHTKSGVYYVTPLYAACPIPVYCDMDTPPGGWMVIQRRQDGQTDFNRNWTDYRAGFGSVGQEFWLGLDNIFLLSNQKHYELRFDLWDFFGSRVHATYRRFHIEGEREEYRLHVANHTGSVADGMMHHDGIMFSTPDRDQDSYPEYHCAKEWAAGWWFANCWFVILNGQYYNHTQVEYRGISWNEWKNEQLMKTEMKMRPSSL